jgi:2-keto-4-pentenoate hydratase/2-oxohepta-3-ene-1,7-dioic acid hydratase in catechol pathway
VTPSKVIGIGTNYRAHAVEMGRSIPPVPKVFLMPSTAVVGPGQPIEVPPKTQRVDHEAELAVVIGRRATRVSRDEALEHVFGYTACNDVTARDFQKQDGVFARAKGFDSFCPIGPWLVTGLDPSDLRVQGMVDGVLRQDGRTSDLIFDVPRLVSFVSHVMTLLPGDVISTGTPSGVGPLVAGDCVRVVVEGVGMLENPVINRVDRSEPGA